MAHGDEVNWAEELKRLPLWVQSMIIWFRLVGLIGVVLVLVGFYVAKDMGFVSDRASIKREAIQHEIALNTQLLRQNQDVLARQLIAIEGHIRSTNRLARNLCFVLRLNEEERQSCVNGAHE